MTTRALPGSKTDDKSRDPEDAVIIDGDFQDITDLQGDIDDTLNSITSEFDADANDVVIFMKVYRVQEKSGKSAWLFNCQPEELPIMEKLRDSYGTGIYQVRVYKNKKLYRRFNYQIEAPKPGQPLVPPPAPTTDLASLIAAMNAQADRNFIQMKEILLQSNSHGNGGGTPVNWTAIIAAIPAGITAIRALMPDNTATLLKFMEIAGNFSGNGKETNMWDIAKEALGALPHLAEMAKSQQSLVPVPAPVPARVPIRAPAPTGSPQPSAENNQAMQFEAIKNQVNMLVNAALRGSDPGTYADLIIDNVPPEMIKQYLTQDTLLSDLAKINPRVTECETWFVQLKMELLEILGESVPDNLTPTGADTDTNSNASGQSHPAGSPDGNSPGGAGS